MTIEKVWLSGETRDQYLCSVSIILAEGPLRFCVRGMRLLDLGRQEPVLAMPSMKRLDPHGNPVFEELFHPLTGPSRDFLQQEIFHHYAQARPKASF